MFKFKILHSEQVSPKYPSLQTQMKVSTLTSTHVAPLIHGELSQAVQFPKQQRYKWKLQQKDKPINWIKLQKSSKLLR